jgi:fructose-1,6-bisphosphatase/inositol monophosphatase family enzyme
MSSVEKTLSDEIYNTAFDAAIKASELILKYWPNPLNSSFNKKHALDFIEKEGTGNYATIADLQSEKKIIEVIQSHKLFKNHSIIAEETEPIDADKNWRWIIDPIDGTPNFRNGNPDFGMCIALFYGQNPVLGLIAMPALRQMVIAKHGEDAKLVNFEGNEIANLRDLAKRYTDPLDKALIGYDLNYYDRQEQLNEIADKIIANIGYASVLASFSTGTFRLLQGMMGLYFGRNPTLMDIAPAACLIPAIGGVITDMEGKPIDWKADKRSFIGAINPHIHQQFLELLQS